MSYVYKASNFKDWKLAKLKNYDQFSESVCFINETDSGYDDLEGDWYYCDDENLVIYFGSFGNGVSPGATTSTMARVYQQYEKEEYQTEKNRFQKMEQQKNCPYCGGQCPNQPEDSEYLCDGFLGDIDNLC